MTTDNVEPSSRLAYTVAEVAEKLSVGRSTVKALVRSGALRSAFVGRGCRRIPHKALVEYLASRTATSGLPPQ
jgi:excisionase family DNA binding protein